MKRETLTQLFFLVVLAGLILVLLYLILGLNHS
jgi:hypothetical protein